MRIGCLLMGVAAMLLVAVLIAKMPEHPAAPTTQPVRPQPAEVSYASFENLYNGMSYAEVCRVAGRQGTLSSQVSLNGAPETKLYTWTYPTGANFSVTFQDDKLVSKAQVGLK
jgi:hypothetical protein